MFEWLKKRRASATVPVVRPRSEGIPRGTRVDLADMSPDPVAYLGQVAYFELAVFESLTRAINSAPDLAAKEGLTAAAGEVLAKHQGVVAELRALDVDPAVAMQPFAPAIDQFEKLTHGRDWYEMLLGVYLTAGFLDDFFIRLLAGLPSDMGKRLEVLLEPDRSAEVIVAELRAGIQADEKLSSRLALWGRRLVGDTQLVARSALHVSGNRATDEERIEPVFTDLIAAHTRRMDGLGLTA
ncbi:ferritin-like fold-containing protein [Alpinimonas psychrophila]|uniref:Ferritin-like domain-containing protein n=1 Tax=Alpinimonas psychrophila TaxID=748908 RepID=A0A7W3PN88_9MICO|nr:hypothetical protein [Alpinimonas psychrophila]